jgi:F-box-like
MELNKSLRKRKIIYDLPNEIIVKIFEHLKMKEKLRFGRTCKWIYKNMLEYLAIENIAVTITVSKQWVIKGKEIMNENDITVEIYGNQEREERYIKEKDNLVWYMEM